MVISDVVTEQFLALDSTDRGLVFSRLVETLTKDEIARLCLGLATGTWFKLYDTVTAVGNGEYEHDH